MQPPIVPAMRSHSGGMTAAGPAAVAEDVAAAPIFITARGVAPLTPWTVQVVMAMGQEMSIIARPARAGFTMLQPMPP